MNTTYRKSILFAADFAYFIISGDLQEISMWKDKSDQTLRNEKDYVGNLTCLNFKEISHRQLFICHML